MGIVKGVALFQTLRGSEAEPCSLEHRFLTDQFTQGCGVVLKHTGLTKESILKWSHLLEWKSSKRKDHFREVFSATKKIPKTTNHPVW